MIDAEKIRAQVQDPMLKRHEFIAATNEAVNLMLAGEMQAGKELLALRWEQTEAFKQRELAKTLPTRKQLMRPEVFIKAVRDAGMYAVAHRMRSKVEFIEKRFKYYDEQEAANAIS